MRYTSDQIERGINHFVSQSLGEPFTLEPESPLDVHWHHFEEQGICPLEFLEDLGQYFGMNLPQHRVAGWLKLSERERVDERRPGKKIVEPATPRTGNELIKLIRRRARCGNFQPRSILGNRCHKAGLFLGICETIGTRERFAPSTHLRTILSTGEYQDLISRLSWMLDRTQLGECARSKRSSIDAVTGAIAFFGWLATTVWLFLADGLSLGITFGLSGGLSIVFVFFALFGSEAYKRTVLTEMAPGIHTFRDLVDATESLQNS